MKLAATGLSELEEALRAGKSETLERWLELLSRFHNYSFRNCLLISVQRPDSTFVAGFSRWKKLGRYVKRGEKGITILAPIAYRKSLDDKETADEGEKVIRGFKAVHVFDVSQTDGKDLPAFASASGEPGELVSRLEQIIRSRGVLLTYGPLPGGTLGVSSEGTIVVRAGLPPAETFSILCHELAHDILHQGQGKRKHEASKTVRETEAEAVAFSVCSAFGIDSRRKSADYIGLYRGAPETLAESLDLIQKTAAKIISALTLESGRPSGSCQEAA
jgi:antirestriction protein ArdC